MTKKEYNEQVQKHLGALEGIAETAPGCDRPCSAHAVMENRQAHELAIVTLIAQYTGNGMSDDIAEKVAAHAARAASELAASHPLDKRYTFVIPGADKMVTVAKTALHTWAFRLIVLPLVIYWIANGKMDKEAVRDVVREAVRSSQLQEQVRFKGTDVSSPTDSVTRIP